MITDESIYSITSKITTTETIRSNLIEKGHITDNTHVVEHYDKRFLKDSSFDFVAFDDNNHPSWTSTNLKKFALHYCVIHLNFLSLHWMYHLSTMKLKKYVTT